MSLFVNCAATWQRIRNASQVLTDNGMTNGFVFLGISPELNHSVFGKGSNPSPGMPGYPPTTSKHSTAALTSKKFLSGSTAHEPAANVRRAPLH